MNEPHDSPAKGYVTKRAFKPDSSNDSSKWHKHDWQYEAEYERQHIIPISVLF